MPATSGPAQPPRSREPRSGPSADPQPSLPPPAEPSGFLPDHQPTGSGQQSDLDSSRLLLAAEELLRHRYESGWYPELDDVRRNRVANDLAEAAVLSRPTSELLRPEAVALAHRVLDDDHPERSALWPRNESGDHQPRLGRATDPRHQSGDGSGQGSMPPR